jgi:hypothetical protein
MRDWGMNWEAASQDYDEHLSEVKAVDKAGAILVAHAPSR